MVERRLRKPTLLNDEGYRISFSLPRGLHTISKGTAIIMRGGKRTCSKCLGQFSAKLPSCPRCQRRRMYLRNYMRDYMRSKRDRESKKFDLRYKTREFC